MAEPASFILLHTNDVHGRVEGLARAAALVERIAGEHPETPVIYVDAGDVEEHTNRLSSATKGAAMHRLLSAASCRAHAVGNATILRYGAEALVAQAREAQYPLLLANMRQADGSLLPGVQPTAILDVGGRRPRPDRHHLAGGRQLREVVRADFPPDGATGPRAGGTVARGGRRRRHTALAHGPQRGSAAGGGAARRDPRDRRRALAQPAARRRADRLRS